MRLTAGQLNRATLARQLLLEREELTVVDGVRRIVAVQAQEPASPYVALWNRLADFEPGELDTAFSDRSVVKATLLRITLHAVHTDDYTAFHQAMADNLRSCRVNDRRYRSTGLTADVADALVPRLVEFATEPRTKDDIEAMFAERLGGEVETRLWWALRTFAPLIHAQSGGPWSFGAQRAFVAAPTEPPRLATDEALQRLIWRYLEGFGPASLHDFALFTMQYKPVVRAAFDALADSLETFDGPDGATQYDVPDAPMPDADTPAPPRLMAMWDSTLLAYVDRSRVMPDDYRKLVIRRNGDVLPTLFVDGYACGVWRPVDGGIEATAFHRLSDDAWDGLATEAKSLAAMLRDRDPTVYRRYNRWWTDLPSAQVEVLPG